jgi:hypothetical protein
MDIDRVIWVDLALELSMQCNCKVACLARIYALPLASRTST